MSTGSAIGPPSALEKNLSEGIECMQMLRAVLIEERGALEQRDSDKLETTAKSKEQIAGRLAVFDRFQAELKGLATESEALPDRWQTFRAMVQDCDRLNRTNGTIIRARQQQVRAGLSLLQGRDRNASTYTPTGTENAASGGRSLTEA